MTDLSAYVPDLLQLVRVVYPDWDGFAHTPFVADEIDYKRAASDFAREQLGRGALEALLRAGDADDFIGRLKAVANKTNLLYLGMPSKGDLALINQPDSDRLAISHAVFELLHGAGDAADRLGAFGDFLAANKLPVRWTFPTYYLFLLFPESEVFVKPGVTEWLSKFTEGGLPYSSQPNPAAYAAIRDGFRRLRNALAQQYAGQLPDNTALDMIAVQSFVYVAYAGSKSPAIPGHTQTPSFETMNPPIIAQEFHGFTAGAFSFLKGLQENSTKAWMDANREQWRAAVFEPMRALFADLGSPLKRLFDPYLLPHELEIAPTTRKVLAHIRKNWSARPGSEYHPYYWGAFYRQHLTRQTDAQWFVTISAEFVRYGLNFGEQADPVAARLQQRIQAEPQQFTELVARLNLTDDFDFVRTVPGELAYMDQWSPGDDLLSWLAKGPLEILFTLPPQEVIALGPRLADHIYRVFCRLFPVYLWAVAEEHTTLVERYLAESSAAPGNEGGEEPEPPEKPYGRADFLADTYLTPGDADELYDLVQEKKQMIFFGPPGTGKTYVARHLGRLLTGLAEPPPERLTVVQFHPAYSYEEFIEGIRPQAQKEDGRRWVEYPVLPGAFVKFCRRAAQLGDAPCVFIIDEINRGNIARIFGELMLLLEYRDLRVPLPYSGDMFYIPSNVTILGTMNTADRSIALVDFALRRRFHFFEFAADPDLLDRWLAANGPSLPWLGQLYRRLTEEALDDAHFRIGPSYFMHKGLTEDRLGRIWRRNILPYLREYYFDQPQRAERWAWDGDLLRGIRSAHGQ